MRQFRAEDGTPVHRRGASYHKTQCAKGKAPLHAQLEGEIAALIFDLKSRARATEDADDVVVEAGAGADSAEIDVEDAIRDLDGELHALDRKDPALGAQKAVFPHGYGAVIDPEGEEQLKVLGPLKVRIGPFMGLGGVGGLVKQLDQATATFEAALEAEVGASEAYDVAFAQELDARRQIRAQFESAYGRLRDFYKARPQVAERFFPREGASRRPAKAKAKSGGAAKVGTATGAAASGTP